MLDYMWPLTQGSQKKGRKILTGYGGLDVKGGTKNDRIATDSYAGDPFLRELGVQIARKIETHAIYRSYQARQIVYLPDAPCEEVFWVRAGRIKESRISDDGRELTFRHALKGDLIGDECILPRKRRENQAEAILPSELGVLPLLHFQALVNEEADLAAYVLRQFAFRMREMERVLVDTVFFSVRSRVASGLLRLYEREPEDTGGILKITHQEIANLIGSTRETTTSVLHHMREEGIVRMANRQITVLDPVRLARLAGRG